MDGRIISKRSFCRGADTDRFVAIRAEITDFEARRNPGASCINGRPYHSWGSRQDQRSRTMADVTGTPTKFPRTDLGADDKPKCRVIVPPVSGGWSEPALFEWELTAESWTDEHPHSEYNFVIEGQLFVESGGVIIEAQTGDVVRVPAGATGRYWAPTYARLLAIYGPSQGGASKTLGYEKLSSRKHAS